MDINELNRVCPSIVEIKSVDADKITLSLRKKSPPLRSTVRLLSRSGPSGEILHIDRLDGECVVVAKFNLSEVKRVVNIPDSVKLNGWSTDVDEYSNAIKEFEEKLPGFWWSTGNCSVGAHASCGVDQYGCQSHLLEGANSGSHPLDDGFHCDTIKGPPEEALRDVMEQALEYLGKNTTTPKSGL